MAMVPRTLRGRKAYQGLGTGEVVEQFLRLAFEEQIVFCFADEGGTLIFLVIEPPRDSCMKIKPLGARGEVHFQPNGAK